MNLFGWCAEIEQAGLIHEIGYDYIECTLVALKLEDPIESKIMIAKYKDSIALVKAVNVFFPGDMKVTGPHVDQKRLRRYIAAASEALHEIGTKIAVMGSGGARRVPEGWDRNQAQEQLMELFTWIADEFTGNGVTLAIEPLNRKESNLINSVSEGVEYVRQINRDCIRVLADFYHMDEENEPLDTLIENKDWLAHIHVADTGRLSPGTGHYPYDTFVSKLKSIGYSGMISAECKVKVFEPELAASLPFLKKKWED
jgi:sugar phosphate isomerase/epimerase